MKVPFQARWYDLYVSYKHPTDIDFLQRAENKSGSGILLGKLGMNLLRLTFILLTCAVASAQVPEASKQSQPVQDKVFKVDVNLVQVDAVVTDSEDRPVTGLQAEDFIILQDGKPREITHFSYIRTADPVARTKPVENPANSAKDATPLPPPPSMPLQRSRIRRTVALVVDDLALSFEGTVRVRESIKKWVDNDMQPGDLVAVMCTAVGVGALQQFTGDKQQLYAAIERIRFHIGRVDVSSFAPLRPLSDSSIDTTTFTQDRMRALTMGSLDAIRYVVNGLRDLPGRKSLILFSENMPLIFRQNDSQFIDFYLSRLVQERLRRVVEAANRAAVVIHAIDPRGLVYTGPTSEDNTSDWTPGMMGQIHAQRLQDLLESQDGMVRISEETGGLFLQGSNDINGALRTVVEDGEGYYLIGYQPDEATAAEIKSGNEKYHRIRVSVKRTGLRVRSRTGFFSVLNEKLEPEKRTRKERLMQALVSPFASEELHVLLTASFSQSEKKKPSINVLLHFDSGGLTFSEQPDGWQEMTVDIAAATFGADGQPIDVSDNRWSLRARGQTLDKMRRDGISLLMNVPVKKPGAYQMRAVLCDVKSGKLGSATRFVEVPDIGKGRLALSGIVLAEEALEPWTVLGEEEGVVALEGGNGSAAVRIFKPGSIVTWACEIFNVLTDKENKPRLQLRTRLFREGQEVFSADRSAVNVEMVDGQKRVFATGRLQWSNAPPGAYAIQVVLLDMLAKEKYRVAAQSIDFEVQNVNRD